MKILIATPFRAIIGGAETYLAALLPRLQARGYSLALLYEYAYLPESQLIDHHCSDIPIWCLTDKNSIQSAINWQPDICYLHGLSDVTIEQQLVAHFPTVFFAHNYYGVCATGFKCTGWSSKTPCNRTQSSSCLGLNYLVNCGIRNPLNLFRNYRVQAQRNQLLNSIRCILVASHYMKSEYLKHGFSPSQVHVNPLFPTTFTPLKSEPSPRKCTGQLLFVGRFTNLKGGDLLIAAMKRLEYIIGPLVLNFAGDGPELRNWRTLTHRLGVNANFLGWCDSSRLGELMAICDLLVVPSVWPEPFGLVGLEAACHGLPCVAFAVGGITEWLIPGETGELAPTPPTVTGLTDAIVRALSDPSHLHRLRVGAWKNSHRFTQESHLIQLEKSFYQLAG